MGILLGEKITLEVLNKFYFEQSHKMMLSGLRGVTLEYNLMQKIQMLECNPYSKDKKECLNAKAKEFFISEEKFEEFEKVAADKNGAILELEECEGTENKSNGCYSYFLEGWGQWEGDALYEAEWAQLDKLSSWLHKEFPDRKKLEKFLEKFNGDDGKYLLKPIGSSHYGIFFDMKKLMKTDYSYPIKIFVYK